MKFCRPMQLIIIRCQIFLFIVINYDCCMYINIDSPKVCKFFWKVLSFYTLYTLSVPPYQPLSTGSGSILGAGASRASPAISIGQTAIVVVRTPYIWNYVSCCLTGETSVSGIEPETCFQSFGHHTKALALSFRTYSFRWVPNHQEPEKYLEKIHWCWTGSNPVRLISSLTLYLLCQRAPYKL